MPLSGFLHPKYRRNNLGLYAPKEYADPSKASSASTPLLKVTRIVDPDSRIGMAECHFRK